MDTNMTNIKLPQGVKKIFNTLKKNGFEAFLVGGSVRDLIMGRKTTNWDFTTNAAPQDILKIFPDSFYDNKFGTVGIPDENGNVYEITTYRSEKGYSDHRHPDKVTWGKTINEDLSRRDFTINAIALSLSKGKPTIIDPYKGQEDINKKIIRAVGNPDLRFNEDALRLLRAIRIATELGFTIEENTFLAIKKNTHLIQSVSMERIREELLRILASDYPSDGVMLLRSSGLLSYILPELEKCFGIEQKSPQRHHIYDVGTHLLMSLKNCKSEDPIVLFATLLHDIGKPLVAETLENGVITFYNHEIVGTKMVRNIADRLHFSKKDRDKLIILVRWHQFSVDERQTDKALRRFIKRVGKENLGDILALRIGDRLGGGARETSWRLELFKKRLEEVQKQPFTVADLKVDGHDVMKLLNIKPGPMVGKVLNKLFEEVEEDQTKNNREDLLSQIGKFKGEAT